MSILGRSTIVYGLEPLKGYTHIDDWLGET